MGDQVQRTQKARIGTFSELRTSEATVCGTIFRCLHFPRTARGAGKSPVSVQSQSTSVNLVTHPPPNQPMLGNDVARLDQLLAGWRRCRTVSMHTTHTISRPINQKRTRHLRQSVQADRERPIDRGDVEPDVGYERSYMRKLGEWTKPNSRLLAPVPLKDDALAGIAWW
jgi:hypothetical protein